MNKGFTLVELLAVIVLLSAIALITTVTIGSTIKNSKTKLTEVQIKIIEKAAQSYYLQEGINENNYNTEKVRTCVNVEYLAENDYIEGSEIQNFKDNNKILGSVKIMNENGIYTYNYKSSECGSSDYDAYLSSICEPVTEDTKTTGNVPQGNYLPGDEYICEVKPGTKYRFFVLSTNNKSGEIITSDTEVKDIYSVNLIMNQNINNDGTPATKEISQENSENGVYNLVPWVSKEDYNDDTNYGAYGKTDKGPITAMKFLNNATSSWSNIPSLNMIYDDEGKHFENFIITGKSRLVYYNELYDAGCDYSWESCPVWLVDYLKDAKDLFEKEYQKNPTDIYGYHIFSSNQNDVYEYSMYVDYQGFFEDMSYARSVNGIRPVITLEI